MKTKNKCKLPYCKECNNLYPILFIVSFIIVIYWLTLKNFVDGKNIAVKDAMNYKVIDFPILKGCCSWWPISHFLLYLILGILFPDCGVLLMTLGVGWELFENLMGRIISEGTPSVEESMRNALEYKNGWWAGSVNDIIMNFFGFICGWFIAKKLGFKVCIPMINSNTKWCKGQ